MVEEEEEDEVMMVSNDMTLEDRFLEEDGTAVAGGRSLNVVVGFLVAKIFNRSCNFCFW